MFKGLRKEDVIIPANWFEARVTLPASMLAEIWLLANAGWVLAIVGVVVLAVTVALLVTWYVRRKNREEQSEEENHQGEDDQEENPILDREDSAE